MFPRDYMFPDSNALEDRWVRGKGWRHITRPLVVDGASTVDGQFQFGRAFYQIGDMVQQCVMFVLPETPRSSHRTPSLPGGRACSGVRTVLRWSVRPLRLQASRLAEHLLPSDRTGNTHLLE